MRGGAPLARVLFAERATGCGLDDRVSRRDFDASAGNYRGSVCALSGPHAPVAGPLAAMTLHALWKFSSVPLGLISFLGTYLLVMVPALLAIRHYLTPELHGGLSTPQQYAAFGSAGDRMGAAFRVLSTGGFAGWRAYSRFSQATTELAFHRERVQRSVTSVACARREAAYVETLRELREQV